jgi:hypothetical protein
VPVPHGIATSLRGEHPRARDCDEWRYVDANEGLARALRRLADAEVAVAMCDFAVRPNAASPERPEATRCEFNQPCRQQAI